MHQVNKILCKRKIYCLFCVSFSLKGGGLMELERFSLDCRKTKTKANTLANQRA